MHSRYTLSLSDHASTLARLPQGVFIVFDELTAAMDRLSSRLRQSVASGLQYARAVLDRYERPCDAILHAELCADRALPLVRLFRPPQAPLPRFRRVAHAGHMDYG